MSVTLKCSDRKVCLARRKLPDGKWQVIRLKDWKVIHEEKNLFVNEMLGNSYRWVKDGKSLSPILGPQG